MKCDNPFSLTFGMPPYKVIGRYEEKGKVISAFQAENAVSHVFLIEGIRGSGKTVLMTSISEVLCQSKDWVGVDLNTNMDLLENLAESLRDLVLRLPDIFEQGFNVSIGAASVGIGGSGVKKSKVGEIEDILKILKKRNKRLIITIDEVSATQNMRVFASQFQIFLRKKYPAFLIMTGLYQNIYEIQNDETLTFLLRSPKLRLEALSLMQIAMQYEEIFKVDEEMATRMARETKGYAFAFQALGMLVWEKGTDALSSDEAGLFREYDSLLDDFAYKKIWSELTKREQEIVLSVKDTEKTKVSEVCGNAGISSSMFSQYKERLINKGVIVPAGYGYVELTLPRFNRVCRYYNAI